ncbi:hypothetical protein [Mycoplasma nasistruthionis]|uniref:Uncharacterized protein n=1 Tax=Mycoplasma nasistruthionis TaxID=353852 RepID=A0A5B7XU72_9MOLU|nr:hypothetical protein [Mycoplasma nasistruthionis]QCZ36426.1 hypothetical protein FG904_00065 [Mycoplasma nasistruthionis]
MKKSKITKRSDYITTNTNSEIMKIINESKKAENYKHNHFDDYDYWLPEVEEEKTINDLLPFYFLPDTFMYDNLNNSTEALAYLRNLENNLLKYQFNTVETKQYTPLTPIINDQSLLLNELNDWQNKPFGLWKYHAVIPTFKGYKFTTNNSENDTIEYFIDLNIPKNQQQNINNYWFKHSSNDPNAIYKISVNQFSFAYLPDFLTYQEYVDKYKEKWLSLDWWNYNVQNKIKSINAQLNDRPEAKKYFAQKIQDFNSLGETSKNVDYYWWTSLYKNNTYDLDFYSNNSMNNSYLSNNYDLNNNYHTTIKISAPKDQKPQNLMLYGININNYEILNLKVIPNERKNFYQSSDKLKHFKNSKNLNEPILLESPRRFNPFFKHIWNDDDGYDRHLYWDNENLGLVLDKIR